MQGQETRQLRELLRRFIPRLFWVIPRQISTKNFGVVIYERNRSSRPLYETMSSSWTADEEISPCVLQLGNPMLDWQPRPFLWSLQMDKNIAYKMIHGPVWAARKEDGTRHFQNEPKGDCQWTLGAGLLCQSSGSATKGPTWEDDTGVLPVGGCPGHSSQTSPGDPPFLVMIRQCCWYQLLATQSMDPGDLIVLKTPVGSPWLLLVLEGTDVLIPTFNLRVPT